MWIIDFISLQLFGHLRLNIIIILFLNLEFRVDIDRIIALAILVKFKYWNVFDIISKSCQMSTNHKQIVGDSIFSIKYLSLVLVFKNPVSRYVFSYSVFIHVKSNFWVTLRWCLKWFYWDVINKHNFQAIHIWMDGNVESHESTIQRCLKRKKEKCVSHWK